MWNVDDTETFRNAFETSKEVGTRVLKSKKWTRPLAKLWVECLGYLHFCSPRWACNRLRPPAGRQALQSSSGLSEPPVKGLVVEPGVNLGGILMFMAQ